MKESISTEVVTPDSDSEELTIIFEDNVLVFQIAGKEVFSGDWHGNLEKVFWEALRKWGHVGE